jgi:hypothetical protein
MIHAGTYAKATAGPDINEFPESDIGFALASASKNISASGLDWGSATAIASASNRFVKVEAIAEGHFRVAGFPFAAASAYWSDTLRITAPPGTFIPDTLYQHVALDGLLYANSREETFSVHYPSGVRMITEQGRASAWASMSILGRSIDFGGPLDVSNLNDDLKVLNDDLVIEIPTQGNFTFFDGVTPSVAFISWAVSADVSAFVDGPGFAGADLGHTITIGKLTMFADSDAVPEDYGYTLSFDSGFPSPNSIPEPSTFTLAAIGAIVLLTLYRLCRDRK